MKFRITAAGQVVEVEGNPMAEAERLHKLTGKTPKIERIDDEPVTVREAPAPAPGFAIPPTEQSTMTQPPVPRGEGHIDAVGQVRSTLDAQVAVDSGFSLKQPLYTRGTRVIEAGVENARTSRLEHDAMPTAREVHLDLARQIQDETRKDFTVRASNLLLREDGKLTTREKPLQGIPLSERSFSQLVGRLDIPAAGAYLRQCPPPLRAMNVNHWIDRRLAEERLSPDTMTKELQLRMRGQKGSREIFAVTGPRYASYDADMIAEAVAQAAPAGSRGTVAYDGYRAHGEVLFHSTVQPEHYVAGEVFRAGVSWSTDDTGGGAIICRATVWQNLCLNLIIIDQSEQDVVRLRHQGSVEKLADGFRAGFQTALGKISHFVGAWDEACVQNIMDVSQEVAPLPEEIREMSGEDARLALIAASIRGMMDRELVTIPGRREDVVRKVALAWQADDSGAKLEHDGLTRAALANALTRYAHESGDLDPWEQDQLQAEAGQLVYGAGRYARIPLLGEKVAA